MAQRKVLLMGGGGGLVGSAVLEELGRRYPFRSYHRTPLDSESGRAEFVSGSVEETERFPTLLKDVGAIVNVVWYREPGPDRLFARTAAALDRLVEAAVAAGVERFVQLSLPPAPPELEARTPYLRHKRAFESRLVRSPLRTTLLQPSAIFADGDRLIHVMRELLLRHRHFPFWGDGSYHVSPIWSRDVAWLVGEALEGRLPPVVLAGGPERFTYAELLQLLEASVGRPTKRVHVSPRTGRAAVRFLNLVGWHVLYTYEYDWLLSDLLGLPPPPVPGRSWLRLQDFLRALPVRGVDTAATKVTVPAGPGAR